MPMPSTTPDEFAAIWHETGGQPSEVARRLRVDIRNVYARRRRLEAQGYDLLTRPCTMSNTWQPAYPIRQALSVEDGVVVVYSDRHCADGDGVTAAEAALLALLPVLRPVAVISNGDEIEGAAISRHDAIGNEVKGGMLGELTALKAHLQRIQHAAPQAHTLATVGNHSLRYDSYLAKHAKAYSGIEGFRLQDHMADWPLTWSVHINADVSGGHTVVKHRLGSGVTAGRTNGVKAGVHIVTGHTHCLSVDVITDYAGRRYSVQTGMLQDRDHPAFSGYQEDSPSGSGMPGFAVLTYRNGVLLRPELCELDEANVAWFRGEPVGVKPRVRVKASSR